MALYGKMVKDKQDSAAKDQVAMVKGELRLIADGPREAI